MADDFIRLIDTGKIIRSADSAFIRSLPGFIVNLIRKFICEDEINKVISDNREKAGVPFINGILNDWKIKVEVRGEKNIPPEGRFIFVSNHPVGALDALSLFSMIYRYFPDVVTPANEMLGYIPNMKPVILAINVFGRNSRDTAQKIKSLFESDAQIMFFPSGEVSRRSKGTISDPPWFKTFVTKAVTSERDIIPVHISGRNSGFFYFVANLRKFLGIKTYLETMLLPREMIKQRNSTFTLTVGSVIPYRTLMSARTPQQWAQFIKETVYKLPDLYV
jgi:putative hemolysin